MGRAFRNARYDARGLRRFEGPAGHAYPTMHYPQHSYIFDYADRNGILFIPEIPVWQFSEKQLSDPKILLLPSSRCAK